MGYERKASQGSKISGQVRGPASIPDLEAAPYQGTRGPVRHDAPGIRSRGFARALEVALGCPKESGGHSLLMQAVLASSGGSSFHRCQRQAGDS